MWINHIQTHKMSYINLKYINTHIPDMLYIKELNQAPSKVVFKIYQTKSHRAQKNLTHVCHIKIRST